MKKAMRLTALALVLILLFCVPVQAAERIDHDGSAGSWTEEALFGDNRYETAREAALLFAEETGAVPERVIMVYGNDFPDALSACSLAGYYHCPIILSKRTGVPSATLGLLRDDWQGKVKTVTVVGGGFSESVIRSQLNGVVDEIDFTSFAGINRYDTAEKVARFLIDKTDVTAFALVTGVTAADALSFSSWSYQYRIPILLAKSNGSLPASSMSLIRSVNTKDSFDRVYIIGADPVVSVSVEVSLAPDVKRLAGSNRYETSLIVARHFLEENAGKTDNFNTSVVVSGKNENYPDALVGGPLAGERQVPVLLVGSAGMTDTLQSLVRSNMASMTTYRLTLLGAAGTGSIHSRLITQLS